MQLVRGEGDGVGAERAGAGAGPEGLGGVDVKVGASPVDAEQAGDLLHRLDGANLVLHQHDSDDGSVGADGGSDRLGPHDAVRGGRDYLERVALGGERLGGAHDRRVLERADDDVASPGCAGRTRSAQQAQRVGLGAAAGEDDLLGLDVQRPRQLPARVFERAGRRRARRMCRGRVGEVPPGRLGHRIDHLVGGPRRGGVVQVDHERRL